MVPTDARAESHEERPPTLVASRIAPWMLALSAVVPAVVAALHVGNVADAAHDEGTVRALGLGWTGLWRGADALASALYVALPVGTRAARAALAACLACGLAGGALYRIARRLVSSSRADAGTAEGRLEPVMAAVASTTATLSAAWQLEATSVAGGTIGAFLVIAPVAIALDDDEPRERLPLLAFALALAGAYEPLAGLTALGSVAAFLLLSGTRLRPVPWLRVGVGVGVLLGLAPMALTLTGRRSLLAVVASAFARSAGEGEPSSGLWAFVRGEVGVVGLGLAAVGAALGLAREGSRARTAALVVLVGVGLGGAVALGAPFGPARVGAPVLAALGVTWALAGMGMYAVARAVAEARIPLASASAAMIVVMALTFPALSADDALLRLEARDPSPAALWSDVAFGALPARAVVLVRTPGLLTRLLASRAMGELRSDLSIVPLGNIIGPLASRELALEPRLVPLWRDLLLSDAPEEWALSSLASARSLAMPFDPRWERSLARHLVPAGLVATFEPEPRGASDRGRALDAFAADRDRLAASLRVSPRETGGLKPSAPKPPRAGVKTRGADAAGLEPELVHLTGALLLDRALTFAAVGERELAARALDDARLFEASPRVSAALAGRLAAATRGPVDVSDLTTR